MKPKILYSVSRQMAYGLHELLRTNASNINSSQDWFTLFSLLECVGAGAAPPSLKQVTVGMTSRQVHLPQRYGDAGK